MRNDDQWPPAAALNYDARAYIESKAFNKVYTNKGFT